MPLIGLLSDSHGQAAVTRRGVSALVDAGAEMLLHMGDVGTVEVIDALVVEGVESRLVFGNTDWERTELARYATGLGVIVDDPVGRLQLGNRELVYLHGDSHVAMNKALASGVDYLCHGHTHEPCDQRVGKTRVINPGALCRTVQYSVALLDVKIDKLVFCSIDKR